jgi:hypothetical protein
VRVWPEPSGQPPSPWHVDCSRSVSQRRARGQHRRSTGVLCPPFFGRRLCFSVLVSLICSIIWPCARQCPFQCDFRSLVSFVRLTQSFFGCPFLSFRFAQSAAFQKIETFHSNDKPQHVLLLWPTNQGRMFVGSKVAQ